MNGRQVVYMSRCVNDTESDSMDVFNVNFTNIFNVDLQPNATYNFTVDAKVQVTPTGKQ